jgi:Pyruvate/2-oxoacid:ferredoxin oxidoreductase delta subunit
MEGSDLYIKLLYFEGLSRKGNKIGCCAPLHGKCIYDLAGYFFQMLFHFEHPHHQFEPPHWENPVSAHRPLINHDLCQHCGTCAEFCHMGAIVLLDMAGHYEIHPDHCVGCGTCVRVCPVHAIELVNIGGIGVLA